MSKAERTASVEWQGDLPSGKGSLFTVNATLES